MRPWAWVSFGIAGAGLLVGSGAGALAIAKKNDLEEGCSQGGPCSKDDFDSQRDRASTLATVSTLGFVVAGTGAATGVGLWLLDPARPDSARLRIVIQPTAALLESRF